MTEIDPFAPAPFDGERFHDPEAQPVQKTLRDVAKWRFGSKPAPWPAYRAPQPHEPVEARVAGTRMRVTFIGHATVLIQTAGLNILTDPFLSDRASPLPFMGPKRTVPPGLPFEALPPIDLILYSHNHYDHMDMRTLARLTRGHRPHVVAPLKNRATLAPHLDGARLTELDWGESLDHGGARVTALWTRHWSRRGFNDTNRALWAAYVIASPAGSIYFAGDTAHRGGAHFDAAARLGPHRLALLPIGAYAPRGFMRDQHMNPEEAVDGYLRCGAARALAIHHGTIRLTDEAIDAPVEDLKAALAARSVAPDLFRAPPPGASWEIPI